MTMPFDSFLESPEHEFKESKLHERDTKPYVSPPCLEQGFQIDVTGRGVTGGFFPLSIRTPGLNCPQQGGTPLPAQLYRHRLVHWRWASGLSPSLTFHDAYYEVWVHHITGDVYKYQERNENGITYDWSVSDTTGPFGQIFVSETGSPGQNAPVNYAVPQTGCCASPPLDQPITWACVQQTDTYAKMQCVNQDPANCDANIVANTFVEVTQDDPEDATNCYNKAVANMIVDVSGTGNVTVQDSHFHASPCSLGLGDPNQCNNLLIDNKRSPFGMAQVIGNGNPSFGDFEQVAYVSDPGNPILPIPVPCATFGGGCDYAGLDAMYVGEVSSTKVAVTGDLSLDDSKRVGYICKQLWHEGDTRGFNNVCVQADTLPLPVPCEMNILQAVVLLPTPAAGEPCFPYCIRKGVYTFAMSPKWGAGSFIVGCNCNIGPFSFAESFKSLAKSAAKATTNFLTGKAVLAEPGVSESRMETCLSCDKIAGHRCSVCKCYLPAKTRLAHEKCPIGKW